MSDYYLCEDLIDDILTRLPPKSLLRFRLLSKSLCTLITSRDFIRKHTFRHSPAQKVFFRHKSFKNLREFFTLHSQDQLPLSPEHGYNGIAAVKFLQGNFNIVGSCNGILCLLDDTYDFTLWNPSIKRKLTIPVDDSLRRNYSRYYVAAGFGFDPTADDYKIVRICRDKYLTGVKKSFVYSMSRGTWFEVASPTSPISYMASPGCFVNGALHWIAQRHRYILTFDLSSHVFGTIALPEPSQEARQLTIINGSLAVVFYSEDGIRVMRRECNNTSSWPLVYTFSGDESFLLAKVMQLPATGDLVVESWYHGLCVLSKTREKSKPVEFNDSVFKVDQTKMFVESLELLDRGTAYE